MRSLTLECLQSGPKTLTKALLSKRIAGAATYPNHPKIGSALDGRMTLVEPERRLLGINTIDMRFKRNSVTAERSEQS